MKEKKKFFLYDFYIWIEINPSWKTTLILGGMDVVISLIVGLITMCIFYNPANEEPRGYIFFLGYIICTGIEVIIIMAIVMIWWVHMLSDKEDSDDRHPR